MRIGCHTSIAGSLENAALRAQAAGANTLQIFSTSPRMWRASVPAASDIQAFRAARVRFDLNPLVIHSNYLLNLASSLEELRAQSAKSLRGEIQRALAIGAEYLVVHPGNFKGYSVEHGIVAVARSIAEAADGLDTAPLTLLLENTAGAGQALGRRFEELAIMRDCAEQVTELKVGFCIDTCHCHSSGYDVATEDGWRRTAAEIERVLGFDHVKVIHANDSKTPFQSGVDRHENIGAGTIGKDGFRRILTHPKLSQKPFILETPVPEGADHREDIATLKLLAAPTSRRPSRSRSKSGAPA